MRKPGGGSADDEDEDDEDGDEDEDVPIPVPTPRRAQTKRKLSTASPNRFDSLAKVNPPPPSKNDGAYTTSSPLFSVNRLSSITLRHASHSVT